MPWLPPVQLAATTIARRSQSPDALRQVLAVLDRLEPDDYSEFLASYCREGLARFGADWGYMDLLTTLQAAAALLQPRRYLEIGVRRGRSLAVVAGAWPGCDMVGFDLWIGDYAGMANPGSDFVRREVGKAGHTSALELVSGDSRQTVPEYLARHPDRTFDLVTVDGDHSEAAARADLTNVIPRVALGGVLVLDDIAHPEHPHLDAVWRDVVGSDPRFGTHEYRELGYGVAFAVRRS